MGREAWKYLLMWCKQWPKGDSGKPDVQIAETKWNHHPHLPSTPMTALPGSICCGKKGNAKRHLFFQWGINQGELSLTVRFSIGPWEVYWLETCPGKVPVGPLNFQSWCSNFVQAQQLLEWLMIAGMLRAVPHVLFSRCVVGGREAKLHLLRY